MVTKEQKIDAIRSAAIAANPTRQWTLFNDRGEWEDLECRLADVLLAISEKEKFSSLLGLMAINGGFYNYGKIQGQWNLREDNLEDQTPETIDFLYSLLK